MGGVAGGGGGGAVRVGEGLCEQEGVDDDQRRDRVDPARPADGAHRAGDLALSPVVRAHGLHHARRQEEQGGDPGHDEPRLLDPERDRDESEDRAQRQRARLVQEAEAGDGERQRHGREVDVLAREAAVVEDARADGEDDAGAQRGRAADLAAQEVGEGHQRDPHQGGREPGGEVAVAQQLVDQTRQVEAHGAVQQRVVLVGAGVVLERVGEVRVLALVVVERARAEVEQAQEGGDGDQPDPDQQLRPVAIGETADDAIAEGPAVGDGRLRVGGCVRPRCRRVGHVSRVARRSLPRPPYRAARRTSPASVIGTCSTNRSRIR